MLKYSSTYCFLFALCLFFSCQNKYVLEDIDEIPIHFQGYYICFSDQNLEDSLTPNDQIYFEDLDKMLRNIIITDEFMKKFTSYKKLDKNLIDNLIKESNYLFDTTISTIYNKDSLGFGFYKIDSKSISKCEITKFFDSYYLEVYDFKELNHIRKEVNQDKSYVTSEHYELIPILKQEINPNTKRYNCFFIRDNFTKYGGYLTKIYYLPLSENDFIYKVNYDKF